MNDELKVLAEGMHSAVADPLIVVARDVQTYQALRALVGKLPEMRAEDFDSQAVVAVFLGQRMTGGYRVRLEANGAALKISEEAPPPDAMVTQVLTTPFKTVAIKLERNDALTIAADRAWQQQMRPYRLDSGEVIVSGGLAGRTETHKLAGELRIMRHEKLVTILFDLQSDRGYTMKSAATGLIGSGGKLTIGFLNLGRLIPPPCSGLSATGSFADAEEARVQIDFAPAPCDASDAFSGRGTIKATATAPAPPKRGKEVL